MVEIGERQITGGMVRIKLCILAPIGFGGGEIESQFGFGSAQAIELGAGGPGGDELGERRAGFGGRAARLYGSRGQGHGAEEDALQSGFNGQVFVPNRPARRGGSARRGRRRSG